MDPLDNDCVPALHEGAGDCLAESWGDAAEHSYYFLSGINALSLNGKQTFSI